MSFLKNLKKATKREFIGKVTSYEGGGRYLVSVDNQSLNARSDNLDCRLDDLVMVRLIENDVLIIRKLGSYETEITEERIDV